jgi:hypothetical protein
MGILVFASGGDISRASLNQDPSLRSERQPFYLTTLAYFQKGFFNPAGLRALSIFVSAPESSEIFSSVKREEVA